MTEVGIQVRILRNTEKFKGATERFILTYQNNKLFKNLENFQHTYTEKFVVPFLILKIFIFIKKLCINYKSKK